jgi:hypothetical protein
MGTDLIVVDLRVFGATCDRAKRSRFPVTKMSQSVSILV